MITEKEGTAALQQYYQVVLNPVNICVCQTHTTPQQKRRVDTHFCMLRGILFIELRATVPDEDTYVQQYRAH